MSTKFKAVCTTVQGRAEVTSVVVSGDGYEVKADAEAGALLQPAYLILQGADRVIAELGFRAVGDWVQIAPEFPVVVEHDIDRLPLCAHRYEVDVVMV